MAGSGSLFLLSYPVGFVILSIMPLATFFHTSLRTNNEWVDFFYPGNKMELGGTRKHMQTCINNVLFKKQKKQIIMLLMLSEPGLKV